MFKTKKEIESWLDEYKIIDYFVKDDLTVNVENNVFLINKGLVEIPIQFNVVNGDFYCGSNNLTSLRGSPKELEGTFSCSDNKLTTLKFCPDFVRDNFVCMDNLLTILDEIPNRLGGLIILDRNPFINEEILKLNTEEIKKYI